MRSRRTDEFLYRDRIWVDTKDFAVIRLEARPAKDPSFWARNSEIEQAYMKVGGFWLPACSHSVIAIRFGVIFLNTEGYLAIHQCEITGVQLREATDI